jgi:hypothetical protein
MDRGQEGAVDLNMARRNSSGREDELVQALNEDRRRMARVDRRCNVVAEQTADLAGRGVSETCSPISTGSSLRRFTTPPRLVAELESEGDEITLRPALDQRPDWGERLSDTFGVGTEAAFALLSKLRRNISPTATASMQAINDALARVHAFAPQHLIEAELVVAALVAEHHASRQLMASESGGHLPTILERTRLAQKFMALQLHALDRMTRGRGLAVQTIRVERLVLSGPTLIKHETGGRGENE